MSGNCEESKTFFFDNYFIRAARRVGCCVEKTRRKISVCVCVCEEVMHKVWLSCDLLFVGICGVNEGGGRSSSLEDLTSNDVPQNVSKEAMKESKTARETGKRALAIFVKCFSARIPIFCCLGTGNRVRRLFCASRFARVTVTTSIFRFSFTGSRKRENRKKKKGEKEGNARRS